MKKSSKILSLLLAMSMVFALLAGCSGGTTTPSASTPAESTPADTAPVDTAPVDTAPVDTAPVEPAPDDATPNTDLSGLTIGYVTIQAAAPWGGSCMSAGLQAACDQRGWKLEILNANAEVTLFNEQAHTFIDKGVDALVLFGGDPLQNVDIAKDAQDAGIPVFMAALDVAEGGQQYVVACVGPDQEEMCYDIGQFVIEDNGGTDAAKKVVIISGVPFLQDYIDRQNGFARAMEETNYDVLATQHAYSSRPDAKKIMEDYISAYGDSIDVLMGFDDDLTMGGVAAIEEAGLTDKIKVYSLTGQNDAIQAVKDGKMVLTVMNRADGIMAELGNAIEEYFTTGTTEYYHYTPLTYITSENVDEYIGKGEF